MNHKLDRSLTIALLVALALPLEAWAGLHYKSKTWQEGSQANDSMNMTVEGWVEGEGAKIVFSQSGNPWMPAGSYLVTQDGGRTLYLVDPEDKSYGVWDLDAIMKMAGGLLGGMKGVFSMEFDNPRVETLLEEPGGTLLGLPTTHYRYRTSYDLRMKVLGMNRSQSVETVQDIWFTEAIGDPAFGVWLRKEPPQTGHEDLDRLIALETSKIRGFPLKTVDQSTMTGKKGKETTTRTITEVVELERGVAIAPGTFTVPAGYTEKQIMPTGEMAAQGGEATADEEPEEEEKGGMFGRLKKRLKKDDG